MDYDDKKPWEYPAIAIPNLDDDLHELEQRRRFDSQWEFEEASRGKHVEYLEHKITVLEQVIKEFQREAPIDFTNYISDTTYIKYRRLYDGKREDW